MSKQIYKDTQEAQSHVVLQAMAMTMAEYDYDTVRDIYIAVRPVVTPIERSSKQWKEAGWTAVCGSIYGLRAR